jgi:nitroreductase
VQAWRGEPAGDEVRLDHEALASALRRRRSVRRYGTQPLPARELEELLAWSEAPVPADVPRVVHQRATVVNVAGLAPGTYDVPLSLRREHDADQLRRRAELAVGQDTAGHASVNVFQVADLDEVLARHGDRGYRWAQLEAGIRAGRLQVGAAMRGWGAVASTFFDDEVSDLLETREAPMLMVSLGSRATRSG